MSDEHFKCGSRPADPNGVFKVAEFDFWQRHANGDRTCSFCGSLHEDDFLAIAEAYATGIDGFRFDTTDKGYKVYASRPGVQNAQQGGIKFYGWHARKDASDEFDQRRRDIFGRAALRHRAEMKRLLHGHSNAAPDPNPQGSGGATAPGRSAAPAATPSASKRTVEAAGTLRDRLAGLRAAVVGAIAAMEAVPTVLGKLRGKEPQ